MGTQNLSGKIALVTGASRGIGRAIARRLSLDGAAVAVNYISNANSAAETAAEIKAGGGDAIALQADVSKLEDIHRLFDQTIEHFGRIDILINNAGIRISKNVADIDEAEYDRLFAINVKGTFFACQLAARQLSAGGRIVNISSAVTRMMLPGYSIYAASKGAVDQITRVLAKELGGRHITVNAVAPGPVDTELFRDGKSGEQIQQMAQMAALGRIGEDEDIADAVAFLVSDDARWITGQTIHVNGGFI
ncbi:MAG: SDR family oxidoreductase [Deltaproteobacteria bacterium]|nr:SDR family oxidoreductase [Deltaproteobacteria bacterium]MBW2467859.1 SDR family oxidoreductase [Deltaproteobacteria bacterium]MBW2487907.1 SDR family oxidoreductase [Deltaproteobacteria bacterium]